MQQELAQCKAKLSQLQIKDFNKLLPLCKASTSKNEVMFINDSLEKYDFDEERERDQVKQTLRNLKGEVSKYLKELKNYQNTQEYLNKIETMSNNILNATTDFKSKMAVKFEDLAQLEDDLTQDLELLESKMDNYENQQKQIVLPKRKQMIQDTTVSELGLIKQKIDQLDAEIDQLNMFEQDDLKDFLRVRTKHKGKMSQQFVNDCLRALPLLSEEQLLDYIEEYNKYLQLEDEKKNLLQEYKRIKEEKKQIQIQVEAQEQQIKENKIKKPPIPQEEREKLKDEIKQWKMKRTTAKVVEEIQDDQFKQTQKEKDEQLRKERELKKQQVEFYKEQKQIQKLREQELSQIETMSKRFVSQEAKERIKLKENQMVEKKRQVSELKIQKKIQDEIKQQYRQEDKYIKYYHVESKLTEPTKAAEQMKRHKYDPKVDGSKYADTFGGNLLGAGRRAIPQWRQNL